MPYITVERRADLYDPTEQAENAGELNYLFTCIAIRYLRHKGKNYQHLNDIVGALEGAKLELYRRVAAPYEGKKIADNGDVYPSDL